MSSSSEEVVIRVKLEAAISAGIAKLKAELAELRAEAEGLDKETGKSSKSLNELSSSASRLEGTAHGASSEMESLSTNATAAGTATGTAAKKKDLATIAAGALKKATKELSKEFGGFTKLFSPLLKGLGGFVGIMTIAKGIMLLGSYAARAWSFALQGVGVAAASALAAVSALLAAQRELALVQMAPSTSQAMTGTGGLQTAVSGLQGSGKFGMISGAALTSATGDYAKNGISLGARSNRDFTTIANFATGSPGDPSGNFKAAASAFAEARGTNRFTGETFSAIEKTLPGMAAQIAQRAGASSSLNDQQKILYGERVFKSRTLQTNNLLDKGGSLDAGTAYEGQLDRINNTLIGKFKSGVKQIKEDLTQIGGPLADALKKPLDEIKGKIRGALAVIGPALQNAFPSMTKGVSGFADKVVTKLTVKIIEVLPKIEGMGHRLMGFFSRIHGWFDASMLPMLRKLSAGFDVMWANFGRPVSKDLIAFLKSVLTQFAEVAKHGDVWKSLTTTFHDILDAAGKIVTWFIKINTFTSPITKGLLGVVSAIAKIAGALAPLIASLGMLLGLYKAVMVAQKIGGFATAAMNSISVAGGAYSNAGGGVTGLLAGQAALKGSKAAGVAGVAGTVAGEVTTAESAAGATNSAASVSGLYAEGTTAAGGAGLAALINPITMLIGAVTLLYAGYQSEKSASADLTNSTIANLNKNVDMTSSDSLSSASGRFHAAANDKHLNGGSDARHKAGEWANYYDAAGTNATANLKALAEMTGKTTTEMEALAKSTQTNITETGLTGDMLKKMTGFTGDAKTDNALVASRFASTFTSPIQERIDQRDVNTQLQARGNDMTSILAGGGTGVDAQNSIDEYLKQMALSGSSWISKGENATTVAGELNGRRKTMHDELAKAGVGEAGLKMWDNQSAGIGDSFSAWNRGGIMNDPAKAKSAIDKLNAGDRSGALGDLGVTAQTVTLQAQTVNLGDTPKGSTGDGNPITQGKNDIMNRTKKRTNDIEHGSWWDNLKNGLTGAWDTSSPHGSKVGDTSSARFNKTMSSHGKFDGMFGGKRTVTSGVRGDNLGSLGSDHVSGAAFDMTGDNLVGYANAVNGSGGFAEMHGEGEERHLHVVPPVGDTASSHDGGTSGGASGDTFHIAINGSHHDPHMIVGMVMSRIQSEQRSARERR